MSGHEGKTLHYTLSIVCEEILSKPRWRLGSERKRKERQRKRKEQRARTKRRENLLSLQSGQMFIQEVQVRASVQQVLPEGSQCIELQERGSGHTGLWLTWGDGCRRGFTEFGRTYVQAQGFVEQAIEFAGLQDFICFFWQA